MPLWVTADIKFRLHVSAVISLQVQTFLSTTIVFIIECVIVGCAVTKAVWLILPECCFKAKASSSKHLPENEC